MNYLKLLISIFSLSFCISSCEVDVINEPDYIPPPINISRVLNSYELWYVNINETRGNGEVPFLQKAFTVSFRNGTLYANNNLVGIGNTGNGLAS